MDWGHSKDRATFEIFENIFNSKYQNKLYTFFHHKIEGGEQNAWHQKRSNSSSLKCPKSILDTLYTATFLGIVPYQYPLKDTSLWLAQDDQIRI